MALAMSDDAALLRDFVNTRDLRRFVPRGHPHRDGSGDVLAGPEDTTGWLRQRGLLTGTADLGAEDHARLRAFRDTLRRTLEGGREPGAEGAGIPLRAVLGGAGGPRLEPTGTGVDAVVGALAAAAVRTAVTGEWDRLRVCAADDCRWVFFDASKPGRGRYCSPDYCGNRVKTRAYRQRRAAPPG